MIIGAEKKITENWINDAYQLLMQKYLIEPNEAELNSLDNLFSDWSSSANPSTLNHLFEIVESHESQKIRDLALFSVKRHFPRDKIKSFIDFWITHPLVEFHEFIQELIDKKELPNEIISVVYLMMNNNSSILKIDPDFLYLDRYMSTLDPLLGSLVYRRYSTLKTSDLNIQDQKRELSIIDLLRLEDYNKLWENVLDYPLPFICELLKLFQNEAWEPIDVAEHQIYGQLGELLGDQGWDYVSDVVNLVISKQVNNKFRSLTDRELRDKDFHLILSPDIINRPDRISNSDFIPRGMRSLTDSDIGIDIYEETVRKSDVDGMLHVPMYSSNGVELAEFAIPAGSANNFTMDEDGMFFTVKSKNQVFSVDIDAIASLLLPVSKHSAGVSEIISTLLEQTFGRSNMVLRGLDLLSTLHRGREFTLFDTRKDIIGKIQKKKVSGCRCTLSIDVGDTTTKVYIVSGGTCDHKNADWIIPSLLYYITPDDTIIGAEVIERSLVESSQTFRYFKNKLKHNIRDTLRIHSEIISAEDAFIDFLAAVIEKITSQVDFVMTGIAVTYSLIMPVGFDVRIRSELENKSYDRITVIDELTASMIKYYRIDNIRGKVLYLNLGSSQISGAVADMSSQPKSRKRVEESLMRDDLQDPFTILTRIILGKGIRDYYPEISIETGVPVDELDDVIKDVLNNFEDRISKDKLCEVLQNQGLFDNFSFAVRDLFVKAGYRGIPKDDLTHIIISGKVVELPIFVDYMKNIFPDQEVIYDKSPFDEAIGAGLVNNGQQYKQILDQDYFCRISNRGSINYSIVLHRGLEVYNITKTFEINQKAWFDKIVIDLWTRRMKIIEDEDVMPLKDNEFTQVRNDDNTRFTHHYLTRELLPIKNKSQLKMIIENNYLKIGIKSDDEEYSIDTGILLI